MLAQLFNSIVSTNPRIMTEQEKQEIKDLIKAEIELKLQASTPLEAPKETASSAATDTRNVNVETVSPTY